MIHKRVPRCLYYLTNVVYYTSSVFLTWAEKIVRLVLPSLKGPIFLTVGWPVNNYITTTFPSYAWRVEWWLQSGGSTQAWRRRSAGSLIPRLRARAQYWRNVSQRHCSCPLPPHPHPFVSYGKNTRTHKSAVKNASSSWIRQVGYIQLLYSTVWLPPTKLESQSF